MLRPQPQRLCHAAIYPLPYALPPIGIYTSELAAKVRYSILIFISPSLVSVMPWRPTLLTLVLLPPLLALLPSVTPSLFAPSPVPSFFPSPDTSRNPSPTPNPEALGAFAFGGAPHRLDWSFEVTGDCGRTGEDWRLIPGDTARRLKE
jgi:hypothetical protein